jgi:hypothetical protein
LGFKAKTMPGAKRQSPKMHWTELIQFKSSLMTASSGHVRGFIGLAYQGKDIVF